MKHLIPAVSAFRLHLQPAWLVCGALLALAPAIRAAEIFKANTSTANLNATGAWNGGVLPTTNDVAVWSSAVITSAANCTNNPGSNLSWLGMKVLGLPAPGRIGAGSNPVKILTLGADGIVMDDPISSNFTLGPEVDLVANSSLRIGAGVTLFFERTFDINSCTVTMDYAGTIEGNGSGNSVFRLGADSVAGTGVVNHVSGKLWCKRTTAQAVLNIGNAAGNTGIYNQSGTAVVDADDVSGSFLRLGDNATSVGFWNLSGNAVAYADIVDVGDDGAGTVTLTENANLFVNALLNLGRVGTGIGVFNLNGGTATVARVSRLGVGTGTATFNFNGGTLIPMFSAADFMTAMNAVNVGNGGAIIDTAGNDITIAHALLAAGTGGLTKRGLGALTIESTNTYTGPTVVAGGRLVLSSAHQGAGSITMQDGTTLDLNVQKGKTLAAAGMILGNSTLNLQLGSSGNATVPVIAATNLSASGTVNLNVTGLGFAVGQFTLIKHSGTIGGQGFAAFQLGPMPAGVTASLVDNQANQSIDLNITAAPILFWLGATEDWDVMNTQNWHANPQDLINLLQYSDGSTVRFDDSSFSTNVHLLNLVYPSGVTVSNLMFPYRFHSPEGGLIAGGGQFVKQGSNSVTMSLANSYAGDTIINDGTFILGVSGAVPDGTGAGNVTVDGVLDLAGFSEGINGLSGTGRVDNVSANPASLTVGNNNAAGAFNGRIENTDAGALTVVKTGNNTFMLSGSNSYAGGTVISAGRVDVSHDAALGTGPVALGALNVRLAAAAPVRLPNAISNAAVLPTGSVYLDAVGGPLTLAGPIYISGADLAKYGTNSLTVTGTVATLVGNAGLDLYEGNFILDGASWTNESDGVRPRASGDRNVWFILTNNASFTMGTVGGNPNFRLGNTASQAGTNFLHISSGQMVFERTVQELMVGDAAGTTGIVYQTGGCIYYTNTANTPTGVLLGRSTGSLGIYYLDGGTLEVPTVRQGSGQGHFHFNGGTLKASSGTYAGTFLQGLTNVTIGNGGATLDSGLFDLVIRQSLLADGLGGLTKNGAGSVNLAGTNTYLGATVVNAGRLRMNTAHAGGGAIQVADGAALEVDVVGTNATLNASRLTAGNGAALTLNLRGSLNQAAPVMQVAELALGASLTLNIAGTEIAPGLYPLIRYTGARSGTLAIDLGSLPKGVLAAVTDAQAPNDGVISLFVAEVEQLKWSGRESAAWDINATYNWTLAGNSEPYVDGSNVRFDDGALQFPDVLLSQTVAPAAIVVSNGVWNYSFSGAGKISGFTSLLKQGSNTLMIATTNDFSGLVRVEGGLLVASNASALGSPAGGTYVTNQATLDVQNFNLNGEPIFISGAGLDGNGALINGSTNAQQNSIQRLTLTADATVGGLSRFDLRGATNTASLSTLGQPLALTKAGTGQFSIVGATVDPALGDLNVLGGTLSFETTTTSFGDPARTLTIASNATFMMYRCDTLMNKRVVIQEGGRFYSHAGGAWTNCLVGPVTLEAGWGRFDANYSLVVSNAISGAGGLEKTGTNRLTLTRANTYAGGTLISAGQVELGDDLALSTGMITLGAAALYSDSLTPRTLTNSLTVTTNIILGDLVNAGQLTLTGPVDWAGAGRNLAVNSDVLMTGVSTNGGIGQKSGIGTLTLRDVTAEWISTFQVYNGTVILDHSTLVKTAGTVRVKSNIAGGLARLVITNGSVVSLPIAGINLRVGYDGNASATNILDLAGTYSSISSAYFGYNAGASAEDVLNLLPGGLLEIRAVRDDGASRSIFNFLGGTLRASTNLDAAIFMQGLAVANVGDAGAVIDTAGFDLTVGQPLLAAGAGGLTKLGAGTLTLTGISTYTGPTLVSGGRLMVPATQAAPGAVAVAEGAGWGVNAVPGTTLTVAGLSFTNATLTVDLGATANPAQPVVVTPALAAQGTVAVTVAGSGLQVGQRFTLVDYSGAIGGAGAAAFQLASQPPGIQGYLTNNQQNTALEYVVAATLPLAISQAVMTGGDLVMGVTGGTPGNFCYLVASTNIAAAANLWLPAATNTFDAGGQTVFTNAIDPALKDCYFRLRLTP